MRKRFNFSCTLNTYARAVHENSCFYGNMAKAVLENSRGVKNHSL